MADFNIEEKDFNSFIKELRDAISFHQDDYLSSIIEKVGIISLKDVIKELKRYNIDASYDVEGQLDEEEKQKRKLVSIGSNFYTEANYVKNLERDEEETQFGGINFLIKMNWDITGNIPYSNKKFVFSTEEERDREWSSLKSKLEFFDVIFK